MCGCIHGKEVRYSGRIAFENLILGVLITNLKVCGSRMVKKGFVSKTAFWESEEIKQTDL